MRRVKTTLIICLMMSLPCGAAFAQDAEPNPYPPCDGRSADTAAAKGAFQAGTAAFNEADYGRAITYWEDAYRRDCNAHALLKNLARAYELDGKFKHAILALRTYTERNPSTAETESLERRISNLERKLEEMNNSPEPSVAASPAVQPAADPIPGEATDDDFSDEEESRGGQRSIAPLFVAGAGAVVAGVGGGLYLGAKAEEKQALDDCGGIRDDCTLTTAVTRGNEARSDVLTYTVVSWAGVGVLAGGLIWYFAQPESKESAQLSPAVAPGFAGFSYSGSF